MTDQTGCFVLKPPGDIWTTECGPVCLQTDTPDAPVLQLETRPTDRSSECISAGLESSERLCQVTMELIRQSPEPNIPPASQTGGARPGNQFY